MSFKIAVFTVLSILFGWFVQLPAQSNYLGLLSSVTLSSNLELTTSTWSLVAGGVTDASAALPINSWSYVPAGSQGFVVFPAATGVTNITTVTMTIGGMPYVLPATPGAGFATFVTPVALARGQGFSLSVPDVLNPPFNPGCMSDPNNYAEASGPCNDLVYVELVNATGGSNFYHHSGLVRFSIARRTHFVQSIQMERTQLIPAPQGTTDNEMLLINIYVAGSLGAVPQLNALSFHTGSTTAPGDILAANVWRTNKLKYFHAPGEALLGTFPNPVGAMNVPALSIPLTKGNNFFWLTYDLRCDQGAIGHVLDGDLLSLTIDGVPQSPTGPSSTRNIGPSYVGATANLISNPGFETYSTCPSILTQTFDNSIAKATGWNYLSPTVGGTSDYFNACAAGGQADVPTSTMGFQVPHGGDGYAGLVLDGRVNNFWEYITTPLTATLQLDTVYYLSFYVSSCDYFASGNPIFKSNGLGAYFTSAPIVVTNAAKLTATPQFQYTPVIYDQQDWVHVFGTFTANGTENRMTVGGFGPIIEDTVATSAYRDVFSNPGSYIFIDDFTLCKLSQVTQPCPVPLANHTLELRAQTIASQTQLSWEAAAIGHLDHFEVLAGASANALFPIAEISSDLSRATFDYTDTRPLQGMQYYAIRQVQSDGSSILSNVISWLYAGQRISVRHPVQTTLRMSGLVNDCPYSLFSLDGRLCDSGMTRGAEIPIASLPAGLYLLELRPAGEPKFVAKVWKQ